MADAGAREVFAQSSRVLALVGRRRRQVRRRPRWRWRRAQRGDLPLQARDLILQARDLLLQRGAILRHRLAGPAGGVRTAERDLPGLIVEAQETVSDAVEGETIWRARRHALRGARRFRTGGDVLRVRRIGNVRSARADLGTLGGSTFGALWPSCAFPGIAAHASTAAMTSVNFRMAVFSRSGIGRPSLPPARAALNPQAAFFVDGVAAVHARARKRAAKICIYALESNAYHAEAVS